MSEEEQEEQKIPGAPSEETAAHSTQQTPGITGGRARTERRVGSGNTRSGSAEAQEAADESEG